MLKNITLSAEKTVLQEAKKRATQELIRTGLNQGIGNISTQVIQEFFNVALRKFEIPFTTHDCRRYLNDVFTPLCHSFSSIRIYETALQVKESTGFSFYDSLILAAAIESGCTILYSEDLCHGQKIDRIKIINPFQKM